MNRREFLGNTLAAGTILTAARTNAKDTNAPASTPAQITRKIKLGLVGCGSRGNWIAGLFKEHGGYEIHAVADYFPDKAKTAGDLYGVDSSCQFSGLSGYKRLIESGVEAVAIVSPPYFHPEQAESSVAASKHVYLAKPVAVDVPGCRTIEECGRKATKDNLVFLVDFQTRTDPYFIEAMRRVHAGGIGSLAFVECIYHAGFPFEKWVASLKNNPKDPETRLRAWGMCKILSGDIITEQNIHTLDVVSWIIDSEPEYAVCECGLTMREPVGTCADHFAGFFQFKGGVGATFSSRQSAGFDTKPDGIRVRAFGSKGVLETQYGGNVMIRADGENMYRGGSSPRIYQDGAVANIAAFYNSICTDDYANTTVAPSIRSNMITILGRTAAYRCDKVKWSKIVSSRERLEADLKGLKT